MAASNQFADWYGNVTGKAVGGTETQFGTNELPTDMWGKMFSSFPEVTPIVSILTRLSTGSAKKFRVDWMEEAKNPTVLYNAATESSASTTVNVVANGIFAVKDTLIYNPRADDLRSVDSNPTANAITVSLSAGGKTSSVWLAGDELHLLLPAIAENDASARAVSAVDTNVFNYTHLAKMQYDLTRTANDMTTEFGGPGSKRQQLKKNKWEEFRIRTEKTIYFGGRATSGDGDETELRMMGGLVHYLKDGMLYNDFNGIMTETGWRNYLGDFKDQNPDSTNVTAFVAGNVFEVIDGFGLGKVRISPLSKELGLDVSTYKSRGMTVNLISLPLLTGPDTRGWGWILDMDRIRLDYTASGRPMYHAEALNVGESEVIRDTFRAQLTIRLANESKHSMFIGALL